MSNNQSIQQTNQTTGQPSKPAPANGEPGVVSIPVGTLVKLSKESTSKAIDSLVSMLTDFFHFSGAKNYIVIKLKLDTPADPFSIIALVPDAEGDLDNGTYAPDVEKEIKQLMHEYLMTEKNAPHFTMEGHYANAAVESILDYAKTHNYDGVLFVGNGSEIKSIKDYEFTAILIKFN
jgi:hypothetical protein